MLKLTYTAVLPIPVDLIVTVKDMGDAWPAVQALAAKTFGNPVSLSLTAIEDVGVYVAPPSPLGDDKAASGAAN